MRERTPITTALLARLPRLRLLITSGTRNAAVDVAAAKAQGIIVCGTDSHPEPAVEMTWALILGLMRNLVLEANALRSDGPWQQTVGRDLYGARLGRLGLGKIGQRVAQIGQAFGMQVSAWSPNLDAARAAAAGVQLATSKQALFAGSDVVSLHPGPGRTQPRDRGCRHARLHASTRMSDQYRTRWPDRSASVDRRPD